jgi:hypothetical protein
MRYRCWLRMSPAVIDVDLSLPPAQRWQALEPHRAGVRKLRALLTQASEDGDHGSADGDVRRPGLAVGPRSALEGCCASLPSFRRAQQRFGARLPMINAGVLAASRKNCVVAKNSCSADHEESLPGAKLVPFQRPIVQRSHPCGQRAEAKHAL